jgi:hypothetical protein
MNMVSRSELSVGGLRRVRAAVFDFNGTMTDDEDMQYEVYFEVVARLEKARLRRYVQQAGRRNPIRAEAAEFVRAVGATVPLPVVTAAPPGEVQVGVK